MSLTYNARRWQDIGKSATVSAASMLGDLLFIAGLAHPGVSPRSITAWRINYTWRTHRGDPTDPQADDLGPRTDRACDEIMQIAGRDLGAALDLGGIPIDELESEAADSPDFMADDFMTWAVA